MPNVPSDVAPAAALPVPIVEAPIEEVPIQKVQPDPALPPQPVAQPAEVLEVGGPPGPEPTRFGDWEKNGRCVDF